MFWKKKQKPPPPPPKKVPEYRVKTIPNGKFSVQEYLPDRVGHKIYWLYKEVSTHDTQDAAHKEVLHLERGWISQGTKLTDERDNSIWNAKS